MPRPQTDRPTGAALIQSLAKAGKPVTTLIDELERSEAVRERELTEKKKGPGRWGFVPDLDAWNALAEEVRNIPPEVGVALMTGRHQLILGVSPARVREIGENPDAVQALLDLVRVLMHTNAVLQEHCRMVSQRADTVLDNVTGAMRSLNHLVAYAAFEDPRPEDDEE